MQENFEAYFGSKTFDLCPSDPIQKTLIIASVLFCTISMYPNQALAGGTWDDEKGQILDDGSSSGKGPFARASITIGEPGTTQTTIHYPVGIETKNSTFYVIGWGNGWGTSGGDEYPEYFDQMVSYGFVVAASHSGFSNDEAVLKAVQDAMNENANLESPLYQKLHAKFGVMGKSGGGIAASNAVQTPDAIAAVIIAASNTGVTDPGLFVTGTEDFGKTPVRTGYEDASGPAIYAEEQDTNHGDLDSSLAAAELSASFMRHYLRGDPNTYQYITNPEVQSGNWSRYEVKNLDNPPTALTLSNTSVDENQSPGPIGVLSTTDPDSGDTFTYELVTGEGDDDNDAFFIEGNVLKTNLSFDFESQNTYRVRISTTDQSSLSYEAFFTVTVNDLQDPYDAWADKYGGSLLIGDKGSDYDLDELTNYYEYAVGGNPTDPTNTSGRIKIIQNQDNLVLEIPQRSDDPNLTYIIESSTDLRPSSWIDTELKIFDTNELSTEVDLVTYEVPTDGERIFLRLRVEHK